MDSNNNEILRESLLNKVKEISEEINLLKIEMTREKEAWNHLELFQFQEEDPKKINKELIDSYERRLNKYVEALAQAQAEKREAMRRKIVEGVMSKTLEELGKECETELKVLERTSAILQDMTVSKTDDDDSISMTTLADSEEDWDWDFQDAQEYINK